MMQTVTEPGGTATQAAILGYHVAGKTGTSRVAHAGGYSREYTAFFAGVVPVDNPRFAMAVVIKIPPGLVLRRPGRGPVFHNVMEGALRLMDVPPDDIDAWLAAQSAAEAKARGGKPAPGGGGAGRWRAGQRRRAGGDAVSRAMLLAELLPDVAGIPGELVITGLVQGQPPAGPGRRVRRGASRAAGSAVHARAQLRRAGARRRRQRDPVRTAGAAEHRGARRCDRGSRPRFAHGRDRRPLPANLARDARGRRHRHQQRQDLHRAIAGAGVDAAGPARGTIGTLGAGLYGATAPTGFTTPLVLQVRAARRPARRRRGRGGDGGELARARPGPRRPRALRGRRVHQPHPRPSRLPRRHGRLCRGEGRSCSRGRACARRC